MEIRKIKVFATSGKNGVIETNVSTLGELKPLLKEMNINLSNAKFMVGETKNELGRDESMLPENDFSLYIMPVKTKSGSSSEELGDLFAELEKVYAKASTISSKISQAYYDKKDVELNGEIHSDLSFETSPEISEEEIEEFNRIANQ